MVTHPWLLQCASGVSIRAAMTWQWSSAILLNNNRMHSMKVTSERKIGEQCPSIDSTSAAR